MLYLLCVNIVKLVYWIFDLLIFLHFIDFPVHSIVVSLECMILAIAHFSSYDTYNRPTYYIYLTWCFVNLILYIINSLQLILINQIYVFKNLPSVFSCMGSLYIDAIPEVLGNSWPDNGLLNFFHLVADVVMPCCCWCKWLCLPIRWDNCRTLLLTAAAIFKWCCYLLNSAWPAKIDSCCSTSVVQCFCCSL